MSLLRLFVAGTSVAAPGSGGSVRPGTPQPGDAGIFETWTGYQSGRFLEGVATGDFNADGAPDVAWARQDSFQNRMMVQLNLGDGTLAAAVGYTATGSRTTSPPATSTATTTSTWWSSARVTR